MPPPSPSSFKKIKTPVTKTSPQLSTSPSSSFSSSSSSSYSSSSTENSPISLSPRTPSPAKIKKPTTAQYDISPYQSSDDDDDEEEEKEKKPVPMWARSEVLHLALLTQTQDPDEIFGDLSHESPNLQEIFNFDPATRTTTSTKKRRSSGNWKKDRLTFKEKWEYKKRMGFVKK